MSHSSNRLNPDTWHSTQSRSENEKAFKHFCLKAFIFGRCERIRTFDPLHPMQVRYQAAPHTEASNYSLRQAVFLISGTEQITNFKEFAAYQLQALLGEAAAGQVGCIVAGFAVFKVA